MRTGTTKVLPVKKFLMKFSLQEKHIRILTNSNSDTVNIVQSSAKTDTIPEIQQINPLVRELCQRDEVIALVLFGSFARARHEVYRILISVSSPQETCNHRTVGISSVMDPRRLMSTFLRTSRLRYDSGYYGKVA